MAGKKSKTDGYYREESISRWNSRIKELKDTITDQAAQIAEGMVDLEGSEFMVIMECMELNRRQIAGYRSLIEEATEKK